jgi:copper chaperone
VDLSHSIDTSEEPTMNSTTCTYTFTVTGMHCGSCGLLIDEALEETDGVHRAQTSVRAGRTVVDADPAAVEPAALLAVIETAGYQAVLVTD